MCIYVELTDGRGKRWMPMRAPGGHARAYVACDINKQIIGAMVSCCLLFVVPQLLYGGAAFIQYLQNLLLSYTYSQYDKKI